VGFDVIDQLLIRSSAFGISFEVTRVPVGIRMEHLHIMSLDQWFSTFVRLQPDKFFFLQDEGPAVEKHWSRVPSSCQLTAWLRLY
jgi:hypothetical protein